MKSNSKELMRIYNSLHKHFGSRHWWPVTTNSDYKGFEIFLGAILTQQTSWKQVEKAIQKLEERNLIDPKKISVLSTKKLSNLIKPVAFYPTKAKRIKELAKKWQEIKKISNLSIPQARKELLQLHGIGPETCDSILLYAFQKSTFVVDAYTKRFVKRYFGYHSQEGKNGYEEVKKFFESSLPQNEKLFGEYHALIVELGKNYCLTRPMCQDCVLRNKCKKMI